MPRPSSNRSLGSTDSYDWNAATEILNSDGTKHPYPKFDDGVDDLDEDDTALVRFKHMATLLRTGLMISEPTLTSRVLPAGGF